MNINLTNEQICTICKVLNAKKRTLHDLLYNRIPNRTANPNKADDYNHYLTEVENVLKIFEGTIIECSEPPIDGKYVDTKDHCDIYKDDNNIIYKVKRN